MRNIALAFTLICTLSLPASAVLEGTRESFAKVVKKSYQAMRGEEASEELKCDISRLARDFEEHRRYIDPGSANIVVDMFRFLLQSGNGDLVRLYYHFVDSYQSNPNFLTQTTGYTWGGQASKADQAVYYAGCKVRRLTDALLKRGTRNPLWNIPWVNPNDGWQLHQKWVDIFYRLILDPSIEEEEKESPEDFFNKLKRNEAEYAEITKIFGNDEGIKLVIGLEISLKDFSGFGAASLLSPPLLKHLLSLLGRSEQSVPNNIWLLQENKALSDGLWQYYCMSPEDGAKMLFKASTLVDKPTETKDFLNELLMLTNNAQERAHAAREARRRIDQAKEKLDNIFAPIREAGQRDLNAAGIPALEARIQEIKARMPDNLKQEYWMLPPEEQGAFEKERDKWNQDSGLAELERTLCESKYKHRRSIEMANIDLELNKIQVEGDTDYSQALFLAKSIADGETQQLDAMKWFYHILRSKYNPQSGKHRPWSQDDVKDFKAFLTKLSRLKADQRQAFMEKIEEERIYDLSSVAARLDLVCESVYAGKTIEAALRGI